MTESCKWDEDENSVWGTGCGNLHVVNPHKGKPLDNGMVFCCYCGKPIEQVDYVCLDDLQD